MEAERQTLDAIEDANAFAGVGFVIEEHELPSTERAIASPSFTKPSGARHFFGVAAS